MSEFDLIRVSPSASSGDLPLPTEELDGKDALLRCFMYAMLSVNNPSSGDVDLADEVWKNISDISDFSRGALNGEWICFNIETGEIGMAFPYKGEWRIRPNTVTDTDIRIAQQKRVESRNARKADDV